MNNYITIDGGTTNTRVCLVSGGIVQDCIKLPIGAKKSIDGNGELKNAIKAAIDQIFKKNNIDKADIYRILVSGMITSEFGLIEIPHIVAPAGIRELNENIKEEYLPEISDIPFCFVPGIKVIGGNFANTDMMRGEETELIGLMQGNMTDCIYVLPGSHSKLIEIDNNGRICKIKTELTGEMVEALVTKTILKDAINLNANLDTGYLWKGYECCEEYGINEALFKIRILKNLYNCTPNEAYGFFMGVILHSEVKQILKSLCKTIIVGGKRQLREATIYLLKKLTDKTVIEVSDESASIASTKGVVKIYEFDVDEGQE